MSRLLAIFLIAFISLNFTAPKALASQNPELGAKLFEANCAGCHPRGGNIVRRGKNLKLKTLQRNKIDTVEEIASLVTQGKNNMSAYEDRLTFQEIAEVSAFVWQQAETGWK